MTGSTPPQTLRCTLAEHAVEVDAEGDVFLLRLVRRG
jgi:hypothetical protein